MYVVSYFLNVKCEVVASERLKAQKEASQTILFVLDKLASSGLYAHNPEHVSWNK